MSTCHKLRRFSYHFFPNEIMSEMYIYYNKIYNNSPLPSLFSLSWTLPAHCTLEM